MNWRHSLLGALALCGSAQAAEIPHEVHTLDNGLEVVFIEDHSLPSVVVDIWYDVGSYDDPTDRSGFAHLFEHLMFKGTPRVPEGQFDVKMEQAGGRNNATTADYRTNYYDLGPSNALELLLWLEADRMTALDITQTKLDVEREVVRNERRQNYEDSPYGVLWPELQKALYPDANPMHRSGIGTHEELMAATVEDVRSFYADWYVPSGAILAVAGDFDPAATLAYIESTFGTLPARDIPERQLAAFDGTLRTERIELTDEVTMPLSVTAWHGPKAYAPGDAERDILSSVLAGSDDARLTRRLVHEEGLALQVDVGQWSSRWDSQFVVMVFTKPDADLARVEHIVAEEVAALGGDRPPTESEVKRAAKELELSLLRSAEGLLDRADLLQRYRMFTGGYDFLNQDIARYRALSAESVRAEAAKMAASTPLHATVLPANGGEE